MDVQISNPNPEYFRLFIAVQVPDEVKREIRSAQDEFRRALSERGVSWTRPEHWHLTLKFLGNVEAARVGELTDAVRNECGKFSPLNLHAERVGCFPDLRRPRVLWVGVRGEGERLSGLASAIENALAGFTREEREGKFTGHITIARIKHLKRLESELLAKLARTMMNRAFGEWTADAIEIMRSELAAGGAKHTCLERLPLRKFA